MMGFEQFLISPGPRLDLARVSPRYGYQHALQVAGNVNIQPHPTPGMCVSVCGPLLVCKCHGTLT